MSQTTNTPDQWLLYDGECPFCAAYVKMVRLRDVVGPMPLINARDGGRELDEALAAGLNLDEGMVLKFDDRLYHGQDCINRLALMTTPSGVFNRINAWVFRSPTRSRLLYPVLRTGRNTVLRLLGRKKLDAEQAR
jgi:predicted DCC family thiol-disulfide oxidoreductase YuxK